MKQFQDILDEAFTFNEEKLDKKIYDVLKSNGLTISVAESVTGGKIADRLTKHGGSSEFFIGGIVGYHPTVKVMHIGVSPKIISKYGIVSGEVAKAMARGIKSKFKTQIGLSTTGAAGPAELDGKTPVGVVFIGLDFQGDIRSKKFELEGTREEIKRKTAQAALGILFNYIEDREKLGQK